MGQPPKGEEALVYTAHGAGAIRDAAPPNGSYVLAATDLTSAMMAPDNSGAINPGLWEGRGALSLEGGGG